MHHYTVKQSLKHDLVTCFAIHLTLKQRMRDNCKPHCYLFSDSETRDDNTQSFQVHTCQVD